MDAAAQYTSEKVQNHHTTMHCLLLVYALELISQEEAPTNAEFALNRDTA